MRPVSVALGNPEQHTRDRVQSENLGRVWRQGGLFFQGCQMEGGGEAIRKQKVRI